MEKNDRIILLSYINRSGSTFLSWQLGRYREIFVCTEAEILVEKFLEDPSEHNTRERNIEILRESFRNDPKLASWGIEKEVCERINDPSPNLGVFVTVLKVYRDKIKPSARIILFKAERLIFLFEKIKSTPLRGTEIHFLSIIRDVRAVYASQKNTPMLPGNRPMSSGAVTTAMQWNEFVRLSKRLEKKGMLHQVYYEKLINDTDREMNNIAGFLRLEMPASATEEPDLFTRLLPEHRKIHGGIIRDADPSKISGWKTSLDSGEIVVIQWLSARWMKESGYLREKLPAGYCIFLFYIPFPFLKRLVRLLFKKLSYRLSMLISGRRS